MRFRFEHPDGESATAELDPAFDTMHGIEPGFVPGFYERASVEDDGTRVYRWAAASALDRFLPPPEAHR